MNIITMTKLHQTITWCALAVLVLVEVSSSKHSGLHHKKHHVSRHQIVDELTENDVLTDDERLALEHSQRVSEAGACDEPKLHVIHVSDHYHGRYFLPSCTLLHRCGKHAGCCGADSLRCVAKTKEKVTLHFYSVKIGDHGTSPERKIEKLTFSNHTKCACAPVQHLSKHDL